MKKDLTSQIIEARDNLEELRKKQRAFEKEEVESKNEKLIGKCFILRYDAEFEDSDCPKMFARVDGHCNDGFNIYGTQVTINSVLSKEEKENPSFKGFPESIISVEVNHSIFQEYIDNGEEITNEEFNEKLDLACSLIKKK